jgi:HD-GYP domain-containing protein (c-di-GMP phosphodiesterase class II)
MFHDIGMVPIESLYHKEEPLTEQEKEQIRLHPQIGADILPDKIDPMVKLIIRNHHENFDGTGYPAGTTGDKINIFARIIRTADAYSAAISKKMYQNAKPPVQVLYEMTCTERKRFYDPIILKVLAGVVQPFPIGTKIQLSNNCWAVVVRHNTKDPFKPQIIIAFDELGDPLDKDSLEPPFYLDQRTDILLKSYAGQNLDFLNNPAFTDKDHDLAYDDILDFVFP